MPTDYAPLRELFDALNAFIAYSRATSDLRDVSSVPYGWAESRIAVQDRLHRAAHLIFSDDNLPAPLHALLESASIRMMQPEATPDELEYLVTLREALKPYAPEAVALGTGEAGPSTPGPTRTRDYTMSTNDSLTTLLQSFRELATQARQNHTVLRCDIARDIPMGSGRDQLRLAGCSDSRLHVTTEDLLRWLGELLPRIPFMQSQHATILAETDPLKRALEMVFRLVPHCVETPREQLSNVGALQRVPDILHTTGRAIARVLAETTGETTLKSKSAKRPKKPRVKRAAAERQIMEHLIHHPDDTAKEVVQAIRCSKGVVVESPAWKGNRRRLKEARASNRDPIALPLQDYLTDAGASRPTQSRAARENQEAIDAEIDARDRELNTLIGDYRREHPAGLFAGSRP